LPCITEMEERAGYNPYDLQAQTLRAALSHETLPWQTR
jgi:hypothetical protein